MLEKKQSNILQRSEVIASEFKWEIQPPPQEDVTRFMQVLCTRTNESLAAKHFPIFFGDDQTLWGGHVSAGCQLVAHINTLNKREFVLNIRVRCKAESD